MKKQKGIALFVCLMILLVLSLFGISAMRMMTSQNMIASSSQGADIAFDAAETGINRSLYSAQQAADAAVVTLPAVVPGGASITSVLPADDKGITSVAVEISSPLDMNDAARAMNLSVLADAGAYGRNIGPTNYRFSATSKVDALGITTNHVQDTVLFTLKN